MRRAELSLAVAMLALAGPAAATAADAPITRGCSTSVYGDLGRNWLHSSLVAGPLAFVRAREYAKSTSSFASVGGGRYLGAKLLLALRTGWVARIVVPAAERRKVALQHAPEDFNKAVVPAEGEHDVSLTACPPGRPAVGPRTARQT